MHLRKSSYLAGLVSFFLSLPSWGADLSPDLQDGSTFLKKTALSISYNPNHKQPDWVFYRLGADQLKNCVKRSGRFMPDPNLPAGESAQLSDYSGSGFDKGHMSPAADNRWNDSAMKESFHLSNVSPQPPDFNQHIWARLEALVRAWGMEEGGLWVATGPVLEEGLPSIGEGHVSTPHSYFKVLFNEAKRKAIAFLMPVNSDGGFQQYALSVSDLEQRTGLNFLHGLNPKEQNSVESEMHLSDWDFQARFVAAPCTKQVDDKGTFGFVGPEF